MKKYRFENIKKASPIFCLGFAMFLGSCTDKFEEYNTNQNEATEEMLSHDNLNIGGFIPQMQKDVIPTSDLSANDYQRAQNLTGDIFSGYMAPTGNWNNSQNNSTYQLNFAKWNDVGFQVAFTKVMPAWKSIKAKSATVNPSTFALAQIIKIAALHRTTDNYGPIPYSQFGKGGLSTPYDSQEDVYKSFFIELNEAIAILEDFVGKNPNAMPLKKFDLVYEGNFVKWIKFANSLKLRLALRLAYVEPELARKYAEEAVNDKFGVILENADNANLHATSGISVFNPLAVIWLQMNDVAMGASMESFLKGYNDPRISSYFSQSVSPAGDYYGVRNGIIIGSRRDKYNMLSIPKTAASDPVQWMVAAEIYLLRSEGAIRGWDMKGNAADLYTEGVKKSFEQRKFSTSVADTYLADDLSKPADYKDVVGYDDIKARSVITIKWNEQDSFESKLERIITQKWIATYPDGQEAWTEFRRTGYPKIFPVSKNYSNGTINTEKQVRRVIYPTTEYSNNNKEVAKAIGLLGGPDNGGTKLWWDKK